MKYLKFEEYRYYTYHIGDYILLDLEEMLDFDGGVNDSSEYDSFGLIVEIENDDDMPYLINFYNSEEVFVREDEIIRKLTSEEIEEFELKKIAHIYNV